MINWPFLGMDQVSLGFLACQLRLVVEVFSKYQGLEQYLEV